jgi:hypothetical protein
MCGYSLAVVTIMNEFDSGILYIARSYVDNGILYIARS